MSLSMPLEFYGEVKKGSVYLKSNPRSWTDKELQWVIESMHKGFSIAQIAQSIGRTEISVAVKIKRLGKKSDTYNDANRNLKYTANLNYLQQIQPQTVLDVFAANSYYKTHPEIQLVDNDKDVKFDTAYHMDGLKLLCAMYQENKKFDVIDLDPYGSAYECFDLAIKMAKKGIIVSFGEWGHKRWKRYDFVRPRYGINNADEFTTDAFIREIQRIAQTNHKQLEVIDSLKYSNFVRIYFKINKLKITEQWDK